MTKLVIVSAFLALVVCQVRSELPTAEEVRSAVREENQMAHHLTKRSGGSSSGERRRFSPQQFPFRPQAPQFFPQQPFFPGRGRNSPQIQTSQIILPPGFGGRGPFPRGRGRVRAQVFPGRTFFRGSFNGRRGGGGGRGGRGFGGRSPFYYSRGYPQYGDYYGY